MLPYTYQIKRKSGAIKRVNEVPTRVEVVRIAVEEYVVWVNLSHRLSPLIALLYDEPLLELSEVHHDRIPEDVFVVQASIFVCNLLVWRSALKESLEYRHLYIAKLSDVVKCLRCIWILRYP